MWSNSTKWWNWKELNRFPPYTSVVVYLLAHSIPFLHEIRQRCKVSLHTNHPAELPGCRLAGRPACPPKYGSTHNKEQKKANNCAAPFIPLQKDQGASLFLYLLQPCWPFSRWALSDSPTFLADALIHYLLKHIHYDPLMMSQKEAPMAMGCFFCFTKNPS